MALSLRGRSHGEWVVLSHSDMAFEFAANLSYPTVSRNCGDWTAN
jgi:hypothetical protein